MKKTLTLLAAAAIACSCTHTASPKHNPDADALLAFLSSTAAEGKVMYGQQDALQYGHSWKPEPEDRSFEACDVKACCGDFPAILGLDLSGIEYCRENNIDGNDFEQMRDAAVRHHERGGIITLSWHCNNPLTGGDAWDVSSNQAVASILPDGEKHEMFMDWLGFVADYIFSIADSDNKPIPVIWRPWHEHSGNWFWWCAGGPCTPDEFKALWKMTYDYMVGERGMDWLLWAVSPSQHFVPLAYEIAYPGDEYVDIIGLDNYTQNTDDPVEAEKNAAVFRDALKTDLEFIDAFAAKHGKVAALCETGMEGFAFEKWWTEALAPALEGNHIAYVLTWRNAWDKPGHFFGPWPGGPSSADFNEWVAREDVLMLNDLKKGI